MNDPLAPGRLPGRGIARLLVVLLALPILTLDQFRTTSASSTYSYTIWTGTPYMGNLATPDGSPVELGVKFRTDLAGTVTGIRFFKGPGNNGTHVGNLWSSAGTLLARATFTNETATGWQHVNFATPVAVSPGVTYVASYYAPTSHYAVTINYFTNQAADNPPLHALSSGTDGPNGVYVYSSSSAFPTQSFQNANYWVDVVMSATLTTPPVASNFTPANASTGVPQRTQVTAQFNEEVQPGTIAFTLTNPAGLVVPAQVTWELHQTDRTATLDPVADLAPGTTYTATLSGAADYAGNVMVPATWSFTTVVTGEPASSIIGQWQPVQKWPMVTIHGVALRSGKYLGWDAQSPYTTSQLYDPSTGSLTPARMPVDSFCAGIAQLADGRVLVAGGDQGDNFQGEGYGPAITAATIYDPSTNSWTRVRDMNLPRWYPALVRLGDGRILAMSGQTNERTWTDTPEVYDPVSNTWMLLSNVNTSDVHEELYPNAFLLPNGKVLVLATSTGHTWTLDVSAQTWTPGPTAPVLNSSSVMYRPGKILISGGTVGSAGYGTVAGAAAAVLDMTAASPAWQTIPPMNVARAYHQLEVLPDGRVAAIGGAPWATTSATQGILPAEVWDPNSSAWTVLAAMQDARMNHSTTVLMPDATLVAAGGGHELFTAAFDYFTAESFSPPYLYGGTRPTITSAPASASYGSSITVQTPSSAGIGSVALIGLAAQTHHQDPGANYQSLAFTVGSGQLSVAMPSSTNTAPPGYYMMFLVSTGGVPSVASMIQLVGTDATPPAVAATSPSNGAANVSVVAAPSATFTKPVQGTTISFTLVDGAGNLVPTTTTYSSPSNSATFTPGVQLQPSTTYTATVTGAADLAGHPMVAPYRFTFTTVSPRCPCTMWPSSTTPSIASAADPNAVELGVKFQADLNGYLTGIRFYKGPKNTGTHIGNLWAAGGAHLATATFTNESPTGWQSVAFPNAVPISAGVTYVASYYAPAGDFAYDPGYFTNAGYDNPPLHALKASTVGGDGVFAYAPSSTFPNTASGRNSNYWVDVSFATAPPANPPTVTATSPAAGATGVGIGATPSATFSAAVQPSSISLSLKDSSGSSVAGSTSYDTLSQAATFTPGSQLSYSTTYTATVTATDVNGRAMASPATWSFTTRGLTNCPCTIWNALVTPASTAANDSQSVELGLKFRTDTSGYITGLRFFKGPGNVGTHVGNLWTDTGTLLATATVTNESAGGWQQVGFANPVAVTAGTNYVVSYFAPAGHYSYDSPYFAASGSDSPPLHALQAGVDGPNGVYVYGSASAFPSNAASSNPNYWVDPVFEYAPTLPAPAVTNQSPAPSATGVSTAVQVTATFSKPIQPGSISFTLKNGAAPVTGGTAYDILSHTATFAPASSLAWSTVFTATLSAADLAGSPMPAPVTWSFTTVGPPCPCSIWPASATPAGASANDGNAVELGVKFRSDVNANVTAVRFYKGAGNTGTHVANLWTTTGTLLATATFSSETATGWQQVSFSTPVAITAGTTYVVSYFAPVGHYSFDLSYFGQPFDNAPLHALSGSAAGGNGVYHYGATSAFPDTASVSNANYWVDVVLSG